MNHRTKLAAAAALAVAGLTACGGGSDSSTPPPTPTPPSVAVGDAVVLTESGQLASFNRATPGTLVGSVVITGLQSGETLHGIDYRPADGLLYGLGSTGRIYTISASSGVATLKSTLRAATGDAFTALAGANFGVDFNPAADRLRVIGNTGQNLRINVDTGDVITDGAIRPATGTAAVTAAAYTNSFNGTVTTALYDIDAATGLLYLQDPPNSGTLGTGVPLGVTATAVNGFDIDARTNTGYAVLTISTGVTGLYRIDLGATTAAATRVGDVGASQTVRGLALAPVAAPTALGLTTDNRLVAFDPKAPNTLTSTVAITGVQTGETVLGIDVRPADNLVYALGSSGRVYTINPTTGAATLKSTLAADPADTTLPYTSLSGTVYTVDFNPAADRLRVITDAGLNLRINVDSGATTTDGVINRASGAASLVAGGAYTNSYAGTTTTVLYDMDSIAGTLARQDPPNNGTLVDVGSLGFTVAGQVGFDIAGGANGLALAALRTGTTGPYSLYSVSLTTGAVALYRNTADLARVGGAGGPALRDIAIRW